MISFIIVDDEKLERSLIVRSFEWEENGFVLLGEAGDGEKGLELFVDTKPDLVLTDISMPFMNGIELSQKIRELSVDTTIIILTGFHEFEYAKSAIDVGVASFLLKPINKSELSEAVLAFKAEFLERKTTKEAQWIIQSQLDMEKKNRFLHAVISGQAKQKKFDEFIEEHRCQWLNNEILCIYVQPVPSNPLKFFDNDRGKTVWFESFWGGMVFLVPTKFPIESKKRGSYKTGVSNPAKGLESIPIAFLQAKQVVENLDHNTIAHYADFVFLDEKNGQAETALNLQRFSELIEKAIRLIEQNYTDPDLSLSLIAKALFVNDSYLSRLFKKETEVGMSEYINNLRMEKAVNLVRDPNKKNYQIAEEIGINDPHYFGQCFKKYTGLTIGEYRKQIEG